MPAVIAVFIFVLAFLGLVFGTSSIGSGELVLGIAIYATAIVLSILLFVIWRKYSRKPVP